MGLDSRFTPRKSVKKLNMDESSLMISPAVKETPKSRVTFDPSINESIFQNDSITDISSSIIHSTPVPKGGLKTYTSPAVATPRKNLLIV